MAFATQAIRAEIEGLVRSLREYAETRKKLLKVGADGSGAGDAEKQLRSSLEHIAQARAEIALFEAAVKNALPVMAQVEQQMTKDLAGVATAGGSLKTLSAEQQRALVGVAQKLDFALRDFELAEKEWTTSKYLRDLAALDGSTKSVRASIADNRRITQTVKSMLDTYSG